MRVFSFENPVLSFKYYLVRFKWYYLSLYGAPTTDMKLFVLYGFFTQKSIVFFIVFVYNKGIIPQEFFKSC